MLCYVKRMPRPAGVLVWTAGAVALHAVVPFELSRLDDRADRPARRPAAVRGAGLVTVAAGAGLMAWALAAHCHAARELRLLLNDPQVGSRCRSAAERHYSLARAVAVQLQLYGTIA